MLTDSSGNTIRKMQTRKQMAWFLQQINSKKKRAKGKGVYYRIKVKKRLRRHQFNVQFWGNMKLTRYLILTNYLYFRCNSLYKNYLLEIHNYIYIHTYTHTYIHTKKKEVHSS